MKIILISIACVAIVVIAATIFMGSKTFDNSAPVKLNKKELQQDNTQKALKEFIVTAENKVLGKGSNLFVFSIKPASERPYSIDSAVVTITKPTTTRFDWNYEAKLQPDGKYSAVIDLPDFGQWEIRVSFVVNNEPLTYPFFYTVR